VVRHNCGSVNIIYEHRNGVREMHKTGRNAVKSAESLADSTMTESKLTLGSKLISITLTIKDPS
jgi:hypothetical protein